MGNPEPNPANKSEKLDTDAPKSGMTWGQRAEIVAMGTTGYVAGHFIAKGITEVATRALGHKVVDEGVRQAAAFGCRLGGLFSR
jgi:hypothetical protein